MKLAVSHDDHGNIITMFDPEKLKGEHGSLTYVPAKGEKHHVLDVPKEFEGKKLEELPKLLHVKTSGSHPELIRKP
jgi:hypothetical protein